MHLDVRLPHGLVAYLAEALSAAAKRRSLESIDWRYLPYIRPIFQAYVREYYQRTWPYMLESIPCLDIEIPIHWVQGQNGF